MKNGSGISGFTLVILALIFIPGLFAGVVAIGLLCAIVWSIDSLVKKAAPANESGKIRLNVPVISAPPLSEEKKNKIIEAALAETNRQLVYVVCPDPEFRRRYFVTVFTRLCERQGVKVDDLTWEKIGA